LEEDFLSKNNVDEAVFYRMNSVAHWRSGLVVSAVAFASCWGVGGGLGTWCACGVGVFCLGGGSLNVDDLLLGF